MCLEPAVYLGPVSSAGQSVHTGRSSPVHLIDSNVKQNAFCTFQAYTYEPKCHSWDKCPPKVKAPVCGTVAKLENLEDVGSNMRKLEARSLALCPQK